MLNTRGWYPLLSAFDSTRDMSSIALLSGANSIPMTPGQKDFSKQHNAEAENLAFSEGLYRYAGDGVELRVLKLFGREVKEENKKDR